MTGFGPLLAIEYMTDFGPLCAIEYMMGFASLYPSYESQ